MRGSTLLLLLMMSAQTAQAGEWVFRPDSQGAIRIALTGVAAELGTDALVQRQDGEALRVQIVAAGEGRCDNGALNGSGPLESVRIAFRPIRSGVTQTDENARCGEITVFDEVSTAQFSGVKAVPELNHAGIGKLATFRKMPRVLLGSVNFIQADGKLATNSVYLDLEEILNETAQLSASFDKPAVAFGEIDALSNTSKTVKLSVSKTEAASSDALPYSLSMESTQVRDNSFQLKSTTDDAYVPYQIKMGDTTLVPGTAYLRTLAGGRGSVDVIDLEFDVQGKTVNGLKAGTRLMDTVTAVVTPKS